MAEFNTNCPHCRAELQVQEEWIGMEVECPQCEKTFVIKSAFSQVETKKPEVVINSTLSSDEKNCPVCGGIIKSKAFFCKHCKTDLNKTPSLQPDKESFFIFICPICGNIAELPESNKDKEYECPCCCEMTIAKEATERACPSCGGMIKIKASICKHCKKNIPPLSGIKTPPAFSNIADIACNAAKNAIGKSKTICSNLNVSKTGKSKLWYIIPGILALLLVTSLIIFSFSSCRERKTNSNFYSNQIQVDVTVKKWFIGVGESWKYGCEYKLYADDQLIATRNSTSMSVTFSVSVRKGASLRAEMNAKNGFGGTKLHEGPKTGAVKAAYSGESLTIECW